MFEFIRSVVRIDRGEAGDPEHAPTVFEGIFGKLPGDHGWITLNIDMAVGGVDYWYIEKRIWPGMVTLNHKKAVVISHPFSGQQHLPVKHSSLLPGLTVNQVMLFVGRVEEKKTIGEQQYGTVGNDEFHPEFHEIVFLYCTIYPNLLPDGNMW